MKHILVVLLVLMPLFAFSQKHTNLKLSHALMLAKKKNLELAIQTLNLQIKNLEADIIDGENYGKLEFIQNVMRSNDAGNIFGYKLTNREASFADFGFSEFDFQKNVLGVQPKDLNYPKFRTFFQTKLHYTLPIYTGNKLSNYKKIKKSLLLISQLNKEKIEKKIFRQVKKIYSDISLLDIFIKNLNLIKKNIEHLENVSQNMVKEGYAKKVDVLEIKSKKANVMRMLHESKANKALSLEYLSFLLNQKVLSIDTKTFIPPKVSDIRKNTIEKSLDIQKAQVGYNLAQLQVDVSRASFLPNAGIVAEYGSSDDTFLGDFADHDSYTVGVQIKWNLFNGGSDTKAKQKAKIEQMKAKRQLELASNSLWLKISKLQIEIEKIKYNIESLQTELDLAKVIYENYLGRYQEKLVSINDVIIKQTSHIELILKIKELQNKKYDKILELEELL